MIQYSIKKSADGKIISLQANGLDCTCPFKNSFPIQDKLGQPAFIGQPCNSTCPHFGILENDEGKYNLMLTCGHKIEIEAHLPEQNKPETKTNLGLIV